MKILLISPYPSLVSYGIRMLSACLKQGGHESAILFMPDTDDRGLVNCDQSAIDQIVELARGKDLIGISLTSNYFLVIKDLCNKLRRKLNIPIVLGGVHPTVSYGDCLDFSDYIFRGESELAFCDFVTNFNSENPRPLSQIDNLIYKEGNKIFINSIKNPSDLDRLPFPDYDGGHFIIVRNKKAVLSHKILQLFLKGSYMTFPTRGCPFKCAYCCNNSYHELYKNNKIFRYRSVPNLINELIWCKEKIDIDSLIFDDDAFLALNDLYLKEFVELFKNKINLPLAITSVNPQMAASVEGKLDILRSLNITFMRMGIQSGSEDIRKNV